MKVLVVVDMQNDFVDGSLGTKEAREIVDKVVHKIEEYDKEGNEVFVTYDTHNKNYLDTKEGKNLPVKHCIQGEHGHLLNEKIIKAFKDVTHIGYNEFFKETFGCVEMAKELKLFLKYKSEIEREECESIELVGLCSDICVISNALILKAFIPEVEIIVDASCCAGVTPESHKNAIEAMKMCQITIKGE